MNLLYHKITVSPKVVIMAIKISDIKVVHKNIQMIYGKTIIEKCFLVPETMPP